MQGESPEQAQKLYIKANVKGIVKIMSKMGISTVQSYRGAQIFEAIGLGKELIDEYFPKPYRRSAVSAWTGVARENAQRHQAAFFDPKNDETLEAGSVMQWRKGEEYHLYNPETIYLLQQACWQDDYQIYKQYSDKLNNSVQKANLRSLMEIRVRPAAGSD